VEKIREEKMRYDAIFMDHMMPGMDGIEATRIIRNEIGTEYAKNVPIIALTANAIVGNEEMFLSNGFNAFISKPIDIMRLDVILNQWVRDKQTDANLLQAEKMKKEAIELVEELVPTVFDDFAVEGVDFEAGISRYEKPGIYLEILRSYTVHTPELLEKLRSLSRETLPQYAITIHGIKGASYGICAGIIGKQAEKLEQAAKAGDYDRVSGENDAFIEATEVLLDKLRELVRCYTLARETERKKAAAPDPALLEKLLDASKQFKPVIMEEILSEMEQWEYEAQGDLVQWLREQLDNLEYEAIRERLETIPLMEPS
jgi:CheY-like chemotaxis protein